MDRHVARLNIEHYRKLVATEPDETEQVGERLGRFREVVRLIDAEDGDLGVIAEADRVGDAREEDVEGTAEDLLQAHLHEEVLGCELHLARELQPSRAEDDAP